MHVPSCFLILSLLFAGFWKDAFGQYCMPSCPCYCNTNSSTLDCSGTGISNVTVCGPLSDFQLVNFSNNAVTELTIDAEGCVFDFSYNKINNVSQSVFYGGYQCHSFVLDISHNNLRRLSSYSVHIESWYFDAFPDLLVNVSFNGIEYLETDAIHVYDAMYVYGDANITIDLSFNKLISVSGYNIFLETYDLSRFDFLLNDNDIYSFDISSLNRVNASFMLINLQNNCIRGFQEKDFEYINRNVIFYLDGNPWICDCNQRWVSQNSTVFPTILNRQLSIQPVCTEPMSVKDRPLLTLSEDEFICPPKLLPDADTEVKVSRGENIELYCFVFDAEPPVAYIDWMFVARKSSNNSEPLGFLVKSCVNCSLVIQNVNTNSEGDYICTVSNGETATVKWSVILDNPSHQTTDHPEASTNSNAAPGSPGVPLTLIILNVFQFLIAAILIVVIWILYKSRRSTPAPSVATRGSEITNTYEDHYDVPPNEDVYEVPDIK